MDADGLRMEINESLLRFIAGVVLHNQVVAQRVGLGGSDSQFVSLLNLHGPLTAGRLAELSGLTTGTVTGLSIDWNEPGSFAASATRPTGARCWSRPVPEAMAELAQHYAEHGRHADAVLRRRDPDQLRVIAEFLAELTSAGGDRPASCAPS